MNENEIVVFSDVHLGLNDLNELSLREKLHLGKIEHTDKEAFIRFIDMLLKNPPERVIILGDLLDFWRKTNHKVLLKNQDVLNKIFSLPGEIYYIVGNHDYLVWELEQRYNKNGKIKFSKDLHLKSGEKKIYFTHGYDLDVQVTMEFLGIKWYESFASEMCRADSSIGGIASEFWAMLTTIKNIRRKIGHSRSERDLDQMKKIADSGTAHIFCGAQPDEFLVFGHTHRPFINNTGSVVNTGCWCEDSDSWCDNSMELCKGNSTKCWCSTMLGDITVPCNGKGIFIKNTYVTINKGKMELKMFK